MQQAAPSSFRRVKFSTNVSRTASNPGLTQPAIARLILLDMTFLLIVAPSTPIARWFLCSLRVDRTTRPSHLHHDCQLWYLTLITRCLWSPAVCRRPACSGE